MHLTIVVPAYNEESNLPHVVRELTNTFGSAGVGCRILFVDDGSRDRTAAVIRELAVDYPNVSGLRLSRNFGHQAAVTAGLQHAMDDAVAVMDADMQDTPTDLLAMYRRLVAGADVVYGVRRTRSEGPLLRLAFRTFYRLLRAVASVEVPLDAGDFCVMRREVLAQLNALPERLRFVRGLRAWVGFRQVPWPIDRPPRRDGRSKYNLARRVGFALDGLVSFSHAPLRLATVAGGLVSALAFLGTLLVLWWKISGQMPRGAGVATIALSVLFLGGVQLLSIGILGEYIGRIFDEVKARPVAIVAEVIGAGVNGSDGAAAGERKNAVPTVVA
jgi:polyisoprenyl-phosphate glycosyltransferase